MLIVQLTFEQLQQLSAIDPAPYPGEELTVEINNNRVAVRDRHGNLKRWLHVKAHTPPAKLTPY